MVMWWRERMDIRGSQFRGLPKYASLGWVMRDPLPQSPNAYSCEDGDGTLATLTSIGSFTPLCVWTISSTPCHTFANECPTSCGSLSSEYPFEPETQNCGELVTPAS